MKPLVIPPAAQRDPQSIQMLSAWVAENGLHCSLNMGMWHANGVDEPRAWGMLLADVIRHIANAHQEEFGSDNYETVQVVLASLTRELDEPTSDVSGGFQPGHN